MSRISKLRNMSHHLAQGDISYDFVGKKKIWYAVSVAILVLSAIGLFGRGLHYGIEFEGGSVYNVKKAGISVSDGRKAVEEFQGDSEPIVQKVGGDQLRIQLSESDAVKAQNIGAEIAKKFGVEKVDTQVVGPSWGEEISDKAVKGLVIFMILVVIYLAFAFEWRMAVAALLALIHDIVITVGVYALVGFEVTPGTVIGLLTILGYSLYDTVVVFDGVKEATRGITKQTKYSYSDASNTALNHTLVRSINTTIVALLPVAALLFVGGPLLGAGMLQDIALSLFVGLAAGAFSSIFIATPFLADLKERTPEMRALRKRVEQRRAADAKKAAEGGGTAPVADGGEPDGDDTADDTTGSTGDATPAVSGIAARRARNRATGARRK